MEGLTLGLMLTLMLTPMLTLTLTLLLTLTLTPLGAGEAPPALPGGCDPHGSQQCSLRCLAVPRGQG